MLYLIEEIRLSFANCAILCFIKAYKPNRYK